MKILLLEDSEYDAGLILRELKKVFDFEYRLVDTREAFEKALADFNPQVILSDHSLPSFDSFEALAIAKEKVPDTPFILVTGSVSEEFAVRSLREGADDYILKGKLTRLSNAIENAIRKRRSELERKRAVEDIIRANRELSTYIYKSTHDLRGPLCSIIGLTDMASKDEKNAAEYMKLISESSRKLDSVLLSLIETMSIKDAEVRTREIDLAALAGDIVEKLRHIDGYEKISFIIELKHHAKLVSDESILASVLRHLLDNAIRYHNPRELPWVKIASRDHDHGIEISISDNGYGIQDEMRDKIFEMFYKGNSLSIGAGLGLYTAKKGVEKLNGKIAVASNGEQGSAFTIWLPGSY